MKKISVNASASFDGMDTNEGTPRTNEKGEILSVAKLSPLDETIEWVVKNYLIQVESPTGEVTIPKNLLPVDTDINSTLKGNGGSSKDDNSVKPMTVDEKMQLNRGIVHLYGPHMTEIINIIQSREPKEIDPDGFEIDLDKLQPSTLRALESYVVSVLGKKMYYKKIAITREQRREVRRKRKLRKLEKRLREVTEVSGNKSDDDTDEVAESSWLSESNSSDSYESLSSRSTLDWNNAERDMDIDTVSDSGESSGQARLPIVLPEMFDTKQDLHRLETEPLSVINPLPRGANSKKSMSLSQTLPRRNGGKPK